MTKTTYSSVTPPTLPIPNHHLILKEGENGFHRPFASTAVLTTSTQNIEREKGFPRAQAPSLPWIPGVSKPNGAIIQKRQFVAGVAVGFAVATVISQLLNKVLVTAVSLFMATAIAAIPAAALYIGNILR
jgi:hypothetical protein